VRTLTLPLARVPVSSWRLSVRARQFGPARPRARRGRVVATPGRHPAAENLGGYVARSRGLCRGSRATTPARRGQRGARTDGPAGAAQCFGPGLSAARAGLLCLAAGGKWHRLGSARSVRLELHLERGELEDAIIRRSSLGRPRSRLACGRPPSKSSTPVRCFVTRPRWLRSTWYFGPAPRGEGPGRRLSL